MTISTKVYTRVDHNGLHVECNDTKAAGEKWRTCTNHKTTEHVPPSFDKDMTKEQLRDYDNDAWSLAKFAEFSFANTPA
jgi:hypothetical protein